MAQPLVPESTEPAVGLGEMTLSEAIIGVVKNATEQVMAVAQALDDLQRDADTQLEALYQDEESTAFEELEPDDVPEPVQDDQIVAETIAAADVVASAVEATIEEVSKSNEPPPLPASMLKEVPEDPHPKNGKPDFSLVEEDPAHPDAGATADLS